MEASSAVPSRYAVPSLSSLSARLSSSFAAGPSAAGDDDLLSRERRHNRLLLSVWDDEELRQLLLDAATTSNNNDDASLYLLLPQSVTLVDVRITREVLETHLVLLQSAARGGEPRPFTSLNGLHGSVLGDGGVAVHQRLRRAAEEDRALGGSVGGWEQRGRGGKLPQLESQIVVLRETTLPPSARLPLKAPIGMLLISDPLFYPGCGWKLPLALRRVTHRFASTSLDAFALADLPQLLYEYQILARWWKEEAGPDGGDEREDRTSTL